MTLLNKPWGNFQINASKEQLFSFLRKKCVEDMPEINGSLNPNVDEFGLVIYGDSFKVWKLRYGRAAYYYTVLFCRITETKNGLTIKWFIRYNLFCIILSIAILALAAMTLYEGKKDEFSINDILIASIPIAILLGYFSLMRYDIKTIDEIKKNVCQQSLRKHGATRTESKQ